MGAAMPPRDASAKAGGPTRARRPRPRPSRLLPSGDPVARTFSGPRFRAQRRSAGLSVHDVAARVGRSCWSIYRYEQGGAQPPISVADALADAVGQPLDRFLADDLPQAVAA